jgi:hypothetical protein
MTVYVWDNTNNRALATIANDVGTNWHRKSATFTTPANIGMVEVRMGMGAGMTAAIRHFRRIMLTAGSDAMIWNQDANDKMLFQSVSDGKTAIAAAITGKGVAASGSDTHQQLATKVGQIQQGNYTSIVPAVASATSNLVSNQVGWVRDIAGVSANAKVISLASMTSSPGYWFIRAAIGSTSGTLAFGLKDANGLIWHLSASTVPDNANAYTFNLYGLQVDLVAGTAWYMGHYSNNQVQPINAGSLVVGANPVSKPAGFDTTRSMTLGVFIASTYTGGANWSVSSYAGSMRLITM